MGARDQLREALAEVLLDDDGLHSVSEVVDAILAVLDQQGWPEFEAFRAECDKVGVPYDAKGLVRHHRGNGEMAAKAWQDVSDAWEAKVAQAEAERDAAMLYRRQVTEGEEG